MDEQEEIIADLIHNFVLPEVEKRLIRERIKKKQAKYLKTVHDTLYNDIEQLPKPQPCKKKDIFKCTSCNIVIFQTLKKEEKKILNMRRRK